MAGQENPKGRSGARSSARGPSPLPRATGPLLRIESAYNVSGPGRFYFKAGLNELPQVEFEAMLDEITKPSPIDGVPRERLAFERLFSDGVLRVVVADPKPASAPAAPAGDGGKQPEPGEPGVPGDEAEAIALVKSAKDSAQLDAWFNAEKRAPVSDAIIDRLKELDGGK